MSVWTNHVAGVWSSAANWTGAIPNANNAIADFNVLTAAATRDIQLNGGNFSVNQLNLASDNDSAYRIGGLNAGSGGTINMQSFVVGPVTILPRITITSTGGAPLESVLSSFLTLNLNAATTIDVQGANTSLANAALITGAGRMTKTGSGEMTLFSANTYSNGTNLQEGALQITNAQALGTGRLAFTGDSTLFANLTGGGTIANNIELNTGVDGTLNGTGTATTFNGVISGDGNLTFGSGLIVLSGANTYTGQMNVAQGVTLRTGATNTLSANGRLNFTALPGFAATLDMNGFSQSTGAISGEGVITSGVAGAVTLTQTNAGTSEYSGVIQNGSGTVSLTKAGSGTLILSDNNSYSGTTTISAGTLQIGNGGNSGTLGTGNVVNNGVLAFNRSNLLNLANLVSGTGSLVQNGTAELRLTANNSYSGGTTINSGVLDIGNNGTSGALGTGAITNNALLRFSRSDNTTVANSISGTGDLNKTGAGTMILTGNNTYSGTTTVLAGVLQVGNNGTAGSIGTGTLVLSSGDIHFNRSNDLLVSGNISGASGGDLVKNGAGTLALTGTNSYEGLTTINAGVLQIGNGGATGSLGTGNVVNNAVLRFNRGAGSTLTVTGTISGTGSVQQNGPGRTILNSSLNSYSGGTTINAGVLQVGGAGSPGSLGTGAVVNNAVIDFATGANFTLNNAISGAGDFVQSGAGTVFVNSVNSYTGETIIQAGTLVVSGSGQLGSGEIFLEGALDYGLSANATVANVISGNGQFVKSGANTLTLTGANSGTWATNLQGGTLRVGNGGTSGALGSGNVTNNGILEFNRSDAVTFGGGISGAGNLLKSGGNTLTLTGSNSYSGATTISGGTLQIGNGGTTGSLGSGNVTNNGILMFNRSNAFTVANTVTGTGVINKTGAGAMTVTGSIAVAGATTISQGSLTIGNGGTSGNISGPVVNNATLVFNRSDAYGQSAISGTGALIQQGAGTTTLSNLSATGLITINNGALEFSDNAMQTNSAIQNFAILSFVLNNQNIVANAISGTGALTKWNSGTLILTGANSYSGATNIENGTVQAGNGSATGSFGLGAINGLGLSAIAAFNRSDNINIANLLTGTLNVEQRGAGRTTLTAVNTFDGNARAFAGTLALGAAGSIANASVTVDAGAAFDISAISGASASIENLNSVGNIVFGGKTLNVTTQFTSGLSGTLTGSAGTDLLNITLDTATASFSLSGLIATNWTHGTDRVAVTGNALGNTLTSFDLSDSLSGGGGNDTLNGNGGNDTLDGGTGNDSLSGGDGNDIYFVDSAADIVIDNGNGLDRVNTTVNYTLSIFSSVEELVNVSASGLALTGNDDNNRIIGAAANDTLNGGLGNDTLDGRGGADSLVGGGAIDLYFVDHVNDVVVESTLAGGGSNDRVNTTVNWTLGAGQQVEELVNLLTSGLTITGNELDNRFFGNIGADTLIGGAGNDTIYGQGGADSMVGGTGNDIFFVDNIGDVVIEAAGQGVFDRVYTSINYTVAAGQEIDDVLVLEGSGSLALTGNEFTNRLYGDAGNDTLTGNGGNDYIDGRGGNDVLSGGAGIDTVVGGAGNDIFVLTPLQADRDIFPDFNFNLDRFQVSNAAFGGGLDGDSNGVLDANRFVANASGTATTADHRFIYDTTQGLLIYDSNGSAAGGVNVIGVVTSSGISAASFNVVA